MFISRVIPPNHYLWVGAVLFGIYCICVGGCEWQEETAAVVELLRIDAGNHLLSVFVEAHRDEMEIYSFKCLKLRFFICI